MAKSLVLIKNDARVLPLRAGARILVAGDAADDVARQTGGWTLSWQENDSKREDLPGVTTIWRGIADAARAGAGRRR